MFTTKTFLNRNWTTTDVGIGFIRRWQRLNNTLGYIDANGTQVCDPTTDDDGSYDLYRQHVNYDPSKPYVCAGLNFSSFNAANINLNAAFAYDSMYAAAYGMHELLYNQKLPKVSGTLLKQAMINSIPFDGITGSISFSTGRTSRGDYGIGDRIAGYLFNIFSFDPSLYVNGSTSGFTVVGSCGTDGIVTFSSTPLYNTADGSAPMDRPADKYLVMDVQTKASLSICAYVLIVLAVLASIFCFVNRGHNLIRAAQPQLLAWTLFGVLVTLIRQLIIMQPVNYSQCVARAYLFHLSFYMILGSLTAKMYRLHLLCNVSSFKKVDVSEATVHYYFLSGLGVLFFYLVLETTISPQIVVFNRTIGTNGQYTFDPNCGFSNGLEAMDYILLVIEALSILGSAALCMATRTVPERVNEAGIASKGTPYYP